MGLGIGEGGCVLTECAVDFVFLCHMNAHLCVTALDSQYVTAGYDGLLAYQHELCMFFLFYIHSHSVM